MSNAAILERLVTALASEFPCLRYDRGEKLVFAHHKKVVLSEEDRTVALRCDPAAIAEVRLHAHFPIYESARQLKVSGDTPSEMLLSLASELREAESEWQRSVGDLEKRLGSCLADGQREPREPEITGVETNRFNEQIVRINGQPFVVHWTRRRTRNEIPVHPLTHLDLSHLLELAGADSDVASIQVEDYRNGTGFIRLRVRRKLHHQGISFWFDLAAAEKVRADKVPDDSTCGVEA